MTFPVMGRRKDEQGEVRIARTDGCLMRAIRDMAVAGCAAVAVSVTPAAEVARAAPASSSHNSNAATHTLYLTRHNSYVMTDML